jgi:hypothetical protein
MPVMPQPWQVYLDAALRETETRAFVVHTVPDPTCPATQINNYVLALTKRRNTLVYTRLRPLADHVRMQQNDIMSTRHRKPIAQCRLLVLFLQNSSTEGGQAASAHLDAWLRTFALTQTKVLIFTRDPILVLWLPALHLRFDLDTEHQQHVLAPVPATLATRRHVARLRSSFCGQCQSAAVCPSHERPPWQAAVDSLLSELGPKVICIRGPFAGFHVHAYMQALIDDNPGAVLLYRTYADTLQDRFPTEERRSFLRERVKLVVLNLPHYSAWEHADRVAHQTSTILRHVESEVSRTTQFLVLCQQQPELPCGGSVLSMDVRRDGAGQPPDTYLNYMIASANMRPGYAPATDIEFSEGDYDTPADSDPDFDARSDASSVPDPQQDPDNFFES